MVTDADRPSDEALYSRVLAGDVTALELLVPRYHGPLLGFLFRQTGDRHLAEDLVQETFTRLVTYRGAPPNRFKPWAFAIATNLARDHFRSAYHRREWVDGLLNASGDPVADQPSLDAPGADERLLREEDRQVVADALQRLPATQREVVILRFYHDLKLEEIAEVVGAPVGTVKSRLYHGLKRLKTWLAAEEEVAHAPARHPGLG